MVASTGSSARTHLQWLDLIKGAAMVWILLNHMAERLFGYPYIANPSSDWPPFAERLIQLRPLEGFGALGPFANAFRYAGWAGDQGVQLFLIASGFGLTWGYLIRRGESPLPVGEFYRRRLLRILPLWWGAHLLVMSVGYLLGSSGMTPLDPRFYLSLFGLRTHPQLLYYGSAAWWYIGLLIQLYLVYPLLWAGFRRLGPGRLLLLASLLAFAARSWGLVAPGAWMDAWLRGMFFFTRLPEFVFGIALAVWMFRRPEGVHQALRNPGTLLAAIMAYGTASSLALTLPGMIFAPAMLGIAAFVLLYALFTVEAVERAASFAGLAWIGVHSYSIYLLHDVFIEALVPESLSTVPLARVLTSIGMAAALTLIGGLLLERLVAAVINGAAAIREWGGSVVVGLVSLGAIVACGLLLLGAEALVRSRDPQEVLGWGERPSLEPHDAIGWRLRPGIHSHLRWEGYDYRIQANGLGFPGSPDSFEDENGAFRIMTLGDAFTSGEGVDTPQSWPRLLQHLLEGSFEDELGGRTVKVSNFAVTGYGPHQYLETLEAFGPRVAPDLILIGLFVNDFTDVLVTNQEFQRDIGFGRAAPNSPSQWIRFVHLRHWIHVRLISPLRSWLNAVPEPRGWYLANLDAFDRANGRYETEGAAAVGRKLAAIAGEADRLGCPVVVLLIPAPIEIASVDRLDYFPNDVDLSDSVRFDLGRPQRLGRGLSERMGLGCYDLREPLRQAEQADEAAPLYFPFNMHWTRRGHEVVAVYVAQRLVEDGWLFVTP